MAHFHRLAIQPSELLERSDEKPDAHTGGSDEHDHKSDSGHKPFAHVPFFAAADENDAAAAKQPDNARSPAKKPPEALPLTDHPGDVLQVCHVFPDQGARTIVTRIE